MEKVLLACAAALAAWIIVEDFRQKRRVRQLQAELRDEIRDLLLKLLESMSSHDFGPQFAEVSSFSDSRRKELIEQMQAVLEAPVFWQGVRAKRCRVIHGKELDADQIHRRFRYLVRSHVCLEGCRTS